MFFTRIKTTPSNAIILCRLSSRYDYNWARNYGHKLWQSLRGSPCDHFTTFFVTVVKWELPPPLWKTEMSSASTHNPHPTQTAKLAELSTSRLRWFLHGQFRFLTSRLASLWLFGAGVGLGSSKPEELPVGQCDFSQPSGGVWWADRPVDCGQEPEEESQLWHLRPLHGSGEAASLSRMTKGNYIYSSTVTWINIVYFFFNSLFMYFP